MVLYDIIDKNIKKKLLWNIFVKILNLNDAIFTKNIYISFYSQQTCCSNQQQNYVDILFCIYPLSSHYSRKIKFVEKNINNIFLCIFFYISFSRNTLYFIFYFTCNIYIKLEYITLISRKTENYIIKD